MEAGARAGGEAVQRNRETARPVLETGTNGEGGVGETAQGNRRTARPVMEVEDLSVAVLQESSEMSPQMLPQESPCAEAASNAVVLKTKEHASQSHNCHRKIVRLELHILQATPNALQATPNALQATPYSSLPATPG